MKKLFFKRILMLFILVAMIIATAITVFVLYNFVEAIAGYVAYDWRPTQQDGSRWMSEDGSIEFTVTDYIGYGTIIVDGNTVEAEFINGIGRNTAIEVYKPFENGEELVPRHEYEYWDCRYKSETEFVAKVDKTTFLEKGQKIRFYRVDGFRLTDYSDFIAEFPSEKVLGAIDSLQKAKEEAEIIWLEVYGDSVKDMKPYIVSYDGESQVWLVQGTLKKNQDGGVPCILIQKSDGKVLAVWHGK